MATISLLITVLVVSGLFFGGRWGYRKITKDDKKPDTTSIVAESGSQTNGTVTPTADFPSVVTDQAASTSVPNTSRSNTTPVASTAPSKGSTEIPNTGAGESTFGLLIIIVILGYLFSVTKKAFLKNN